MVYLNIHGLKAERGDGWRYNSCVWTMWQPRSPHEQSRSLLRKYYSRSTAPADHRQPRTPHLTLTSLSPRLLPFPPHHPPTTSTVTSASPQHSQRLLGYVAICVSFDLVLFASAILVWFTHCDALTVRSHCFFRFIICVDYFLPILFTSCRTLNTRT